MSEVYIRSQNKEKLYRLGGNYACVEYGEYEDIKKKRGGAEADKKRHVICISDGCLEEIGEYFQSIDHAVLKTEIRKVIKDAGVLALLDRIIDHNGNMPDGVGIPVGNLTSQLFANIYLDALDQFIKHELGVEAYIRYMDDFVILSPDKEQLRNWLARIEQFLREELKLEFNPKTTMLAAKNGIDFVGYKHRATHRKVRKDSIKRIKRTIKKCESGKITKEQLQKSIQSWTGHAGHADSYKLRKKIETLAEAAIEKAA
ncbi:RNA-directed DNA polymerase [Waltera sp.]|uniref:RNA-directed DNA polymerase n=1 Tax=Waltera sp. TaxID=2815806 RepID=UPI003AB9A475